MKGEMTINKFLVRLRKKRGLDWGIYGDGRIRTKEGICCPITALYGEASSMHYEVAAYSLGISIENRRAIVRASDSKNPTNKKLRKRILKAAGLD